MGSLIMSNVEGFISRSNHQIKKSTAPHTFGKDLPHELNHEHQLSTLVQENKHEEGDEIYHLNRWVVLIFGSNPSLYPTLQQRFESYGNVIAIHTPLLSNTVSNTVSSTVSNTVNGNNTPTANGNWMCIKYKSALEAEKAICQDGTFHRSMTNPLYHPPQQKQQHRDSTLLAVKRLNPRLAEQLGVDLYSTNTEYGDPIYDHFMSSSTYTNPPIPVTNKNGNIDNPINGDLYADEDSILLRTSVSSRSVKKKDFMDKVLSWIFMWD